MFGNLILSRKVHESLTLVTGDGDHVLVEINRVNGNRVSLSVKAPPAVRVVRTELLEPDFEVGSPVG